MYLTWRVLIYHLIFTGSFKLSERRISDKETILLAGLYVFIECGENRWVIFGDVCGKCHDLGEIRTGSTAYEVLLEVSPYGSFRYFILSFIYPLRLTSIVATSVKFWLYFKPAGSAMTLHELVSVSLFVSSYIVERIHLKSNFVGSWDFMYCVTKNTNYTYLSWPVFINT